MTTPESRTVEAFAFVIWDALSDNGVLRIHADSPKELGDITRAILAAAKEHGLVIGEGELDRAWKEAEEALPEGWAIENLRHTAMMDQRWQAEAGSRIGPVIQWNKVRTVIAEGPTPTDALQALTVKLRESRR